MTSPRDDATSFSTDSGIAIDDCVHPHASIFGYATLRHKSTRDSSVCRTPVLYRSITNKTWKVGAAAQRFWKKQSLHPSPPNPRRLRMHRHSGPPDHRITDIPPQRISTYSSSSEEENDKSDCFSANDYHSFRINQKIEHTEEDRLDRLSSSSFESLLTSTCCELDRVDKDTATPRMLRATCTEPDVMRNSATLPQPPSPRLADSCADITRPHDAVVYLQKELARLRAKDLQILSSLYKVQDELTHYKSALGWKGSDYFGGGFSCSLGNSTFIVRPLPTCLQAISYRGLV